jgi:hypothetical protein
MPYFEEEVTDGETGEAEYMRQLSKLQDGKRQEILQLR